MTPNDHDNPETSAEHETTEFYSFFSRQPRRADAPGTGAGDAGEGQPDDRPEPDDQQPEDDQQPNGRPEAADEADIDLPVMEQLPAGALPDPGYPAMSASPPSAHPPSAERSQVPLPPPPPLPWQPPPSPPPSPSLSQTRPQPGAASEMTGAGETPAGPAAPDRPPPLPYRTQQPQQRDSEAYQEPEPYQHAQRPPGAQPSWAAEPYVAPRPPEEAPPLRGPAVPWSEVSAGTGSPHPGDPLAARSPLHAPAAPASAGGTAGAAAGPEASPDMLAPRHSADALTSDMLLPGKRVTPAEGWRRTLYRATGGLIRVGESAASMRHRDLVNRARTPVASGHHRVAVLSLKGGVGKTTATVGLGSTLASLRGDRVIAVDGNPDRGTLSDKVRLETAATIRDLLNERALVSRYADVRSFTSQAPSRLEILASDRDPAVSVAFSADDYRAVSSVLEHYYSICITDCGTGLLHSAMAGILELADQIVLVSSPSVDGARSASATLDWLEAHDYGDLVRGAVVVLSAIRRKSKSTVDLGRLEEHFAARCRAVVRVPYDPHLEEGAEVELDMLNPETADAYLQLAALVGDGFAQPRRSAANAAPGARLA